MSTTTTSFQLAIVLKGLTDEVEIKLSEIADAVNVSTASSDVRADYAEHRDTIGIVLVIMFILPLPIALLFAIRDIKKVAPKSRPKEPESIMDANEMQTASSSDSLPAKLELQLSPHAMRPLMTNLRGKAPGRTKGRQDQRSQVAARETALTTVPRTAVSTDL